jgi:DNA primase small subunit
MKAATLEFLRQRFGEYYRGEHLVPPPSTGQREWGFVFFDPDYPEIRMRRHIGFPGRTELLEYLRAMAPAHAYYSVAYYAAPGAGTMDGKGWAGADLVFDLDADHIMRGPYDQMLARVKTETVKLVAMLTEELGFDKNHLEVVFSGGRGYHVHIRDIAIRSFGSAERRELIDYVCGIGIDPDLLLAVRSPSPRGWQQRYIAALLEYLSWLDGLGEEEAIAHLSSVEGVGKITAERFYQSRQELAGRLVQGDLPNPRDRGAAGILAAIQKEPEGEFVRRLREKAALADEPVTTDTRRLIRMPTSLHGGSGLRVTAVPLRDLPDFDPLTDAVVFGTRAVKVDCAVPVTMTILGERHTLGKGIGTVPEALAIFLCCRGIAEIAGGS